ncbi:Tetratricopeptide repeat protein [Enhygromyxa salina]|uniref:Tetratricopeptide repeat protein n=2 Tax=Enhygromyxa salina TaxID=215803 RepID=A0A2S9Y4F0_9BACT|nr:Tetratricopeptide repeat protein [Enhygromyxa salina]
MREGDQAPAGTAFLIGRRHALTLLHVVDEYFRGRENRAPHSVDLLDAQIEVRANVFTSEEMPVYARVAAISEPIKVPNTALRDDALVLLDLNKNFDHFLEIGAYETQDHAGHKLCIAGYESARFGEGIALVSDGQPGLSSAPLSVIKHTGLGPTGIHGASGGPVVLFGSRSAIGVLWGSAGNYAETCYFLPLQDLHREFLGRGVLGTSRYLQLGTPPPPAGALSGYQRLLSGAMTQRLSLLVGPPKSGKTTLLAMLMQQIEESEPASPVIWCGDFGDVSHRFDRLFAELKRALPEVQSSLWYVPHQELQEVDTLYNLLLSNNAALLIDDVDFEREPKLVALLQYAHLNKARNFTCRILATAHTRPLDRHGNPLPHTPIPTLSERQAASVARKYFPGLRSDDAGRIARAARYLPGVIHRAFVVLGSHASADQVVSRVQQLTAADGKAFSARIKACGPNKGDASLLLCRLIALSSHPLSMQDLVDAYHDVRRSVSKRSHDHWAQVFYERIVDINREFSAPPLISESLDGFIVNPWYRDLIRADIPEPVAGKASVAIANAQASRRSHSSAFVRLTAIESLIKEHEFASAARHLLANAESLIRAQLDSAVADCAWTVLASSGFSPDGTTLTTGFTPTVDLHELEIAKLFNLHIKTLERDGEHQLAARRGELLHSYLEARRRAFEVEQLECLVARSNSELQSGELDRALDACQAGLALAMQLKKLGQPVNAQTADIYLNMGKLRALRGDLDRALRALDRALALLLAQEFPTATERKVRLGRGYLNRGEAHRRLGHHEQAIADFGRAIEQFEHTQHADAKLGLAAAYNNRAACQLTLHQTDLALADVRAAEQRFADLISTVSSARILLIYAEHIDTLMQAAAQQAELSGEVAEPTLDMLRGAIDNLSLKLNESMFGGASAHVSVTEVIARVVASPARDVGALALVLGELRDLLVRA